MRLSVFALLLLTPSLLLSGDRPEWNGFWWNGLNPSLKLYWVSGYVKAMDDASVMHMGTCIRTIKNMSLKQGEAPVTLPMEIAEKWCENKNFDYHDITMGQFVDGIDEFYKDYGDKQLEVTFAIKYVRDRIMGKSAKELEVELVYWRKCSAAMQAGNLDETIKACSPPDDSSAATVK